MAQMTNTSGINAAEANEKQTVTRALSKRTLLPHFCRYLEDLFLKSYVHHNRIRMRITLALGLVLYLLAGFADLHLDSAARDSLWLIRYSMSAPIMAAALVFALRTRRDTMMQIIYAAAAMTAGAATALALLLYPQLSSFSYAVSMLSILLYIYIISGMRIAYALPCALLVCSLNIAAAFMSHAPINAAFQMTAVQLIIANLAGAYGCYLLEMAVRRSFLHGRMVRLLSDEMIELAGVDELTGLANRRHMEEFYANTWKRAERDHAELSLLSIDVDYLQMLNDHLGRHIGDVCLHKLGTVIRHYRQRPGDFAARHEGGKFLVILYGCNERHGKVIAERLRQDVENLNLMNPASPIGWTVTVSIGVHTVIPSRKQSPAAALLAADTLLYMAKQRGHNRVLSDTDAIARKFPIIGADEAPADKTLILPRH
ncbi:MAG: GGDEF domain-containing protein [Gammaproteobacteria bacterium]